MPRFRSKPTEVEAVQYGPEWSPGLVRRIASFIADEELPDRDDLIVDYVRPAAAWDPPEHATILIQAGVGGSTGWVPVPLGHWVVRYRGNLDDHWPVDPETFQSKYDPV